jgi:RNA 3'-terminal phosphate cyclase (ATP)
MIEIDGSEGGGQILRIATALSALSGKPLRVTNIRGARPKPGLQPQHLLGVTALGQLCQARLEGAEMKSTTVSFEPGQIRACPNWRLDVGTAGSTMLLVQSLLPVLAAAGEPSRVTLTGGTNNPFAPPVEYFQEVFLPAVEPMGIRARLRLHRRGFYPKGGGEVMLEVEPCSEVRPMARTERGELAGIRGLVYSRNLPRHIAERIAKAADERLRAAGLPEAQFEYDTEGPSASPGCGVVLFAEFGDDARLGADALGERGKPAEKVGGEAAQALVREIESGAAVDSHLADQLVIYAALAHGESRYLAAELTDHVRLAIDVTQRMLEARFTTDGERPVTIVRA